MYHTIYILTKECSFDPERVLKWDMCRDNLVINMIGEWKEELKMNEDVNVNGSYQFDDYAVIQYNNGDKIEWRIDEAYWPSDY